jgi:site-specific DNA recombinase
VSHAVQHARYWIARVSTDKQADHGVSLEAQEAKIRAITTVQGTAVIELIVDGGKSAKDLRRPRMERLLTLVDERKVDTGHQRQARPAHA